MNSKRNEPSEESAKMFLAILAGIFFFIAGVLAAIAVIIGLARLILFLLGI